MTPIFVFGTLQHRPLLEAVLGACAHITYVPAALPGYVCRAVTEGPFPMVTVSEGAFVDGFILHGLTEEDHEKIGFYEACFDYQLKPVQLEDGQQAQCYFPPPGRWSTRGDWSLDAWVEGWASLSVLSAKEVMSYRGAKAPDEVAAMFPMIRARAWSRLNAKNSLHGTLTSEGKVDVLVHNRRYANYFALDEYVLQHSRFDGQLTPPLKRAVFLSPDATLVLPYDPLRDRVLMVEQMRMGPLGRGDRSRWQLEPIAGRLDAGETPQEAAHREAYEEAHLTFDKLLPVAQTYCSPGTSTEFYYIFLGLTDLPDTAAGLGGLEDEDEDIRSHLVDFHDFMRMCDAQEFCNAPLVLIANWLARHRDAIRSGTFKAA